MKDAVFLAIETPASFKHGGVDYKGSCVRGWQTLAGSKAKALLRLHASCQKCLPPSENIYRKIYEILLTFKLEHLLTKDQILEIYMNQIFLVTVHMVSQQPLKHILASLSNLSPSPRRLCWQAFPRPHQRTNPSTILSVPGRVSCTSLNAWRRNGFITEQEAIEAKKGRTENLVRVEQYASARGVRGRDGPATYLCQYGNEAYAVLTCTPRSTLYQEAAYTALRRGIMDYERRQHYRGRRNS